MAKSVTADSLTKLITSYGKLDKNEKIQLGKAAQEEWKAVTGKINITTKRKPDIEYIGQFLRNVENKQDQGPRAMLKRVRDIFDKIIQPFLFEETRNAEKLLKSCSNNSTISTKRATNDSHAEEAIVGRHDLSMAESHTEDQYPDAASISDVPSIAEIRDHGDQRRGRTNHRTEDIFVSHGQNPAKILHELKDSDEWMNAHEELKSKQMAERSATETLLYIAREAFQFSRQEANAVLEKMLKQSHCIISGQKTSITNQKSSTTTVDILKRYIFAQRESAVARLTKGFCDTPALKQICKQFCINGIGKATEQYTKACIAVTWSATVDETPIEIQIPKRGEIVDRHKFDPYISRGDKIDFVVWPAILLQDGRLLYKGVVELKANHK